MTKPYKYKGVLAKPIGNTHWLLAALRKASENPAAMEAVVIEDRRLVTERLMALLLDCQIPMDAADPWFSLLLKLAERHVPGFSREPKRGRGQPKKTPDYELFGQMEALMKAKKLKASSAAEHLARKRRLGESADAVETRYRRVKKEMDKVRTLLANVRQESL